jgi:hypothetical protein
MKLSFKLKMAAKTKKLELFTAYYIQQVQILTDINTKLLDYVLEIQSITIQNSISDNNKKIINSSISNLEKIIGKNKSQPENLNRKPNNKFQKLPGNLNRKPNNKFHNFCRRFF